MQVWVFPGSVNAIYKPQEALENIDGVKDLYYAEVTVEAC